MNEENQEEMYYVQDARTFVGNSVLWWGHNGGGYTTRIDDAGLYTKEKAFKLFEDRETDIPWKEKDVLKAIKRHVDMQYLKRENNDTEVEDLLKARRAKTEFETLKKRTEQYENKMLDILRDSDGEIHKVDEEWLYHSDLLYMGVYEVREKLENDFFNCPNCHSYHPNRQNTFENKKFIPLDGIEDWCIKCYVESVEQEFEEKYDVYGKELEDFIQKMLEKKYKQPLIKFERETEKNENVFFKCEFKDKTKKLVTMSELYKMIK